LLLNAYNPTGSATRSLPRQSYGGCMCGSVPCDGLPKALAQRLSEAIRSGRMRVSEAVAGGCTHTYLCLP